MSLQQATLIQSIREYSGVLKPALYQFLELYSSTGIDLESVLVWIIEEELELVYGLFTCEHIHSLYPHAYVHGALNTILPYPSSVVFSHFIKAPRLYQDNNLITIQILNQDLYLKYHTDAIDISFLRMRT